MADPQNETGSGKIMFGSKSLAYLKEKSRTAVEKYTDTSVLFFEIDYEKSKRNFYGELLIKKWKNPRGINVKAIVNIKESDSTHIEDIPNKMMLAEITVYIDHLKELKIDPQLGDYFSSKNRIYFIFDKTIADSNRVQVGVDREAFFTIYHCCQADDEQIQPPNTIDNIGTANEIKGEKQS